jgi:hypothetical protein
VTGSTSLAGHKDTILRVELPYLTNHGRKKCDSSMATNSSASGTLSQSRDESAIEADLQNLENLSDQVNILCNSSKWRADQATSESWNFCAMLSR